MLVKSIIFEINPFAPSIVCSFVAITLLMRIERTVAAEDKTTTSLFITISIAWPAKWKANAHNRFMRDTTMIAGKAAMSGRVRPSPTIIRNVIKSQKINARNEPILSLASRALSRKLLSFIFDSQIAIKKNEMLRKANI